MTILLCTSLRPSPRTRTFCNDLVAASLIFLYQPRGKTSLVLLAAHAHSMGVDRLWLVNSRFGQPKLIDCYDCREMGPPEKIASFLLERVVLRRELSGELQPRHRSLRIVYPQDPTQKSLYVKLVEAVGRMPNDGPFAGLHIDPSRGRAALLAFLDEESKAPCGPQILLMDYR